MLGRTYLSRSPAFYHEGEIIYFLSMLVNNKMISALIVTLTGTFTPQRTHPSRICHSLRRWSDPEGAVVAAWHSQSWFLNFFTVDGEKSRPEEVGEGSE